MKKIMILGKFLLATVICLILSYVPVHAGDNNFNGKTIEVPIGKDYTSLKFRMDFDYYDDYSVMIKSPSGKEYKGEIQGENVVGAVVNESEIGQWEIYISYPEVADTGTGEDNVQVDTITTYVTADGRVVTAPVTETSQPQTENQTASESENFEVPSDSVVEANAEVPSVPSGEGSEEVPAVTQDIPGAVNPPTGVAGVSRRPISPVKVKVEGLFDTPDAIDGEITVATDIVGLKMYLKNDDFVAQWTDTTCGNVNIQVVNAKNLQKIDYQTVQGNYYACPIKSDVEEIIVTVVPAVSSQVEGAEKSYSIKIDNHPDAGVSYEDISLTNKDSIKATCELKNRYSILALVNGREVNKTEELAPGTYEIDIPLEVGDNSIETFIVSPNGNMRSFTYTCQKDVVAPQLDLLSTYEDIVTEDDFITIEGRVDDFSKLVINSIEIEVEGDNTFKYDYKLKEGMNQLAIIASDEAGNETEYDIAVERVVPEDRPVPWLKIIICVSCIGLVAVYIFELWKRRKNPERYVKAKPAAEEHSEYDDVDITKVSRKEKNRIMRGPHYIWEVMSFAIPLIAAFAILTFVIMLSKVQSGSMEPLLRTGGTVIYNRLAYALKEPQRGDVVVFYSDEENGYLGKRIIGLPGDDIEFRDGYVVINGQYCDESAYIDDSVETNCIKEFEVPEGCYFMLGDNRENSKDSRYWEEPYINKDRIVGKYMGKIL